MSSVLCYGAGICVLVHVSFLPLKPPARLVYRLTQISKKTSVSRGNCRIGLLSIFHANAALTLVFDPKSGICTSSILLNVRTSSPDVIDRWVTLLFVVCAAERCGGRDVVGRRERRKCVRHTGVFSSTTTFKTFKIEHVLYLLQSIVLNTL